MNTNKTIACAILAGLLLLPSTLSAATSARDKDIRSSGDTDCPIICEYYPCCKPVAEEES